MNSKYVAEKWFASYRMGDVYVDYYYILGDLCLKEDLSIDANFDPY
jgi:hypothetical protein